VAALVRWRDKLSPFRIERVVDRALSCSHRSVPAVRCTRLCPGLGLDRPLPKATLDTLDYPVLDAAVFHAQPTSEARVANFAQKRSASVGGLLSGRLTSSNEGMWVLFHHDSSAAPQTVQTASPVCGTKNFVSVRLYSAPQLHRTIVAILGICPCGTPDQPQCLLPRLRRDQNARDER
jgi:hypothetical protein